jgi:DNA repair and recombination protein RAD54B
MMPFPSSYCRLDGSVEVTSRQGLVDQFNRQSKGGDRSSEDPFIFLLSARAGGQGLNLVGGNRLVLFDSNWNPSQDCQVG